MIHTMDKQENLSQIKWQYTWQWNGWMDRVGPFVDRQHGQQADSTFIHNHRIENRTNIEIHTQKNEHSLYYAHKPT